jgi:hypothetical protein
MKKSAEEVDTEDVAEKKRKERKERKKKGESDESEPKGDQRPASIEDILRDPEVSGPEAIAAGCASLPEPEPYAERQLRRLERGELETPGGQRKDAPPTDAHFGQG